MKIRFIPKNEIEYDPIVRLRCRMIINALQKEGYDIDYYSEQNSSEILVLGSTDFSRWFPVLKEHKEQGGQIIFDLSENEFRRNSRITYNKLKGVLRYIHNLFEVYNRFKAHKKRIKFDHYLIDSIKISDHITVSSEDIRDSVIPINKNTTIIYEPLEAGYPESPKQHNGQAESIVWIGMPNNIRMLMSIKESLKKLIKIKNITLKVISSPDLYNYYPKLKRMHPFKINFIKWNLKTLWDEISESDIGIAPLYEYFWKSPNKPVTYWAAGLPVVASPSPVYSRLIKPGQNGFIASNIREWSDYLEQLIDQPELRNRLGECGYNMAVKDFNINNISNQWLKVFEKCFSGNRN